MTKQPFTRESLRTWAARALDMAAIEAGRAVECLRDLEEDELASEVVEAAEKLSWMRKRVEKLR